MEERQPGLKQLFRRMSPQRLGGRLVATVVLLALVTTMTTLGVAALIMVGRAAMGHIDAENLQRGMLTIVVSVAVAAVIAVALGIHFARRILGPMKRMVDRVKTQGNLVIEDGPYVPGPPLADLSLPLELREAGEVVDDLLVRLSQRHAELQAAIAFARYAEESLAAVVDNSPEAKVVLRDRRIDLANPSAAGVLGRPPSELANLTLAEAFDGIRLTGEDGVGVHPDDLTGSAFDEPTPVLLESPGGEARWLVWQATRYTDAVHERVILTGRDVTEEQRLQKLRAEIVSLISHDLRSPLAVVVGYLDLLRRPLPNDERERAIAAAKRNAGKMAELLEDLLTAARAEELLGPSAFSPVSLADLAEEVVGSLAPTHPERELRLDLQCRPIVRGEARRLRQAIVNLVTNALKYSPDHEPITVRVACEQARAVLFVIDGGPGVQESERDRVFQRFARVDKVAAERPGVGLGLYIVRTICENHGGHAQARETPGGGATFVIDLPCTGRVDDVGLVDCEGVAAPV